MVMAITATLILGTFVLANPASGFYYDKIAVVADGSASCTTFGESCGDGKLKGRINLVTESGNPGEISIGNGDAKISFKATTGQVTGKTIQFKSNNIIFQNDDPSGIVTFTGIAKERNGDFWDIQGTLYDFTVGSNSKKSTANLVITLESHDNENTITGKTQVVDIQSYG